jgi:hypothetical protein
VLAAAVPTCALGAWGYTMLTGKGAALVIGGMLMASVPLRRLMRQRGLSLSNRGFGGGIIRVGAARRRHRRRRHHFVVAPDGGRA